MVIGVAFALFVFGLVSANSDDDSKMIYGTDNRMDYFESKIEDQWIIRNSTVAFIKSNNLGIPNSAGVYHRPSKYDSLINVVGVCKTERFAYQPAAAFCSGTLIGVDRVMTAGHCVQVCDESFYMVFDYFVTDKNGKIAQIYGKDDVYTCRRLHRREDSSPMGLYKYDYAIIQLDRPVRGRIPSKVVVSKGSTILDRVSRGDVVSLYGYPSGLPAKSDHGGVVVADNSVVSTELDFFQATTDSFGGNSGSGIYNKDGEVVGILVRGKTDYVLNPNKFCRVVNVQNCLTPKCSELYSAEGISYALKAVRSAPACLSDADCSNSDTGSFCELACATGEKCCTGWCTSSIPNPINYDPSECPEYFNYTLTDVSDPGDDNVVDNGFPVYGYVLIGVGLVVLLVGAAFAMQRQKKQTIKRHENILENYSRLPGVSSTGSGTGFGPGPGPGPKYNTPLVAAQINRPRIMVVNIPPNCPPGTKLQVTSPEGTMIQFDVPEGAQPGGPIHLQY